MRVRVSIAVGLTAVAVLALPACSAAPAAPSPAVASAAPTNRRPALLSSAALGEHLLDEDDLGDDYTRLPEKPTGRQDVTVLGCPALQQLDSDAALAGSLAFPRAAHVSFTIRRGSNSEATEDLYSDTARNLSAGTRRIVQAMTSCPEYQVLNGSTVIDISTQKLPTPALGSEQWSQLLTFSTGGKESIVKQTAIRSDTVLLVISGAPALVDRLLPRAFSKATAGR
ncbi:hypothetical protein ACIO3O_34865 [Streptomyces sp. NPDC087440]|uniref:hypothetical protein n=1 Tax=Streptomyces sp. NPDC087440 TaxID=3365790 RepID=UPI0038269C9B